ncbi:MAG: Dipeptidase [Acidobacteria bacterium ADurb.Bin340]|nr:MAG: Dipeptidase [Acidobacteria bacterium ADurb.Bin340]
MLRLLRGVLAALLLGAPVLEACTNILVTKGATRHGATLLTYSDDSHHRYGELFFRPRMKHAPGALREVIDWGSGAFRGRIPEPLETYRRVGNLNEFQVAIGETTFGGRPELAGSGMLDYGSLIYIALERAKTAREAIQVITSLVAEFGYGSDGESLSICDPNEAWILEIMGKGKADKGAVWVAVRLPDGTMSAHANQARIRQFPLNDPANALYSPDVIRFAREKGYFKGADKDFSFCQAYAPWTFSALRACEARVWSVFRRAAPSLDLPIDFVKGDPAATPLPVWIKPDRKLEVADLMALMRDHYEGTPFDMTKDVGAGPFALPYRWRPMGFEVDGKRYIHERAISTQQTAWSFVAELRGGLPNDLGGVLWFGMDDTAATVYVPMYAGMLEPPPSWREGQGRWSEFSWDSAFWVFNFVTNYAYGRWSDMSQDIRRTQAELEGRFLADQADVERQALLLHRQDPRSAQAFLTAYSVRCAEETVVRWRKLGEFLVWKYLDGNVRDSQGKVTHRPYPEAWNRRIVQDHGAVVEVPAGAKP